MSKDLVIFVEGKLIAEEALVESHGFDSDLEDEGC
jgi:hypothetical protein